MAKEEGEGAYCGVFTGAAFAWRERCFCGVPEKIMFMTRNIANREIETSAQWILNRGENQVFALDRCL